MNAAFDPYHEWLGIPPEEQPPNLYRLLGIRLWEDKPNVIENAADQRMAHLRAFQAGRHGPHSQRLLNEVAAARLTLLQVHKKAAYDAQLRTALEQNAAADDTSAQRLAGELAEVLAAAHATPAKKAQAKSALGIWVAAGLVLVAAALAALFLLPGGPEGTKDKPVAKAKRDASAVPTPPKQEAPRAALVANSDLASAAPRVSESPRPPVISPVPSDAAIAVALKTAMEIYKEEYDKARSPGALGALAKKIQQKAAEFQSDPAARYVFLRLARDIATKAGDRETTFAAIDEMSQGFTIEPWPMKGAFISGIVKQAHTTAERKAAAQQALAVAREAQAHDEALPTAEELGKLALAEASKARDKETVVAARETLKQVEQAAKAYKKISSALATLKDQPDDPEANLVAGRYLCFVRGDWSKGLSMLAKGSDAELKAIAAQDLSAAVDPRVSASPRPSSPGRLLVGAVSVIAGQGQGRDAPPVGLLVSAGGHRLGDGPGALEDREAVGDDREAGASDSRAAARIASCGA